MCCVKLSQFGLKVYIYIIYIYIFTTSSCLHGLYFEKKLSIKTCFTMFHISASETSSILIVVDMTVDVLRSSLVPLSISMLCHRVSCDVIFSMVHRAAQ